ncbi:MAG: hypothetical protein ACTS4U_00270 [Candidatus Hodgkinia cicadicola]
MLNGTPRTSVRIDVRNGRSSLIKMKLGEWNFLGRTLRRALMSRGAGWAVVGLSFGNDSHFRSHSKVKGISENVSDVFANAKRLTFVGGRGGTCFRAKVNAEGKFALTGRDVELPKGVKLVNPDGWICRLTGEVVPQMELLVAKCRGYMAMTTVKAAFGAAFDEFAWTNVNFNPIERVTCFSKTKLETSADGFDCKLVTLGSESCNPIEAVAEVCEELISALTSAEVGPSGEGNGLR